MILRLLKYISYLFFSKKLIQSARATFGKNGVVPLLLESISATVQSKVRKLVLAAAGGFVAAMGLIYLLFHTAAEYDRLGEITFNAQKGLCLALMLIGAILILYPARKPKDEVLQTDRMQPVPLDTNGFTANVSTERAARIHAFAQMMAREAGQFLERSTRPPNSERNFRNYEALRPEKSV